MKHSQRQLAFRKTAACPASTTLLSFRDEKLSRMLSTLVSQHLGACEFCRAELPLLAHHRVERSLFATPEIPTNLRILAESILGEHEKVRQSNHLIAKRS
jgi:hypothetical protein